MEVLKVTRGKGEEQEVWALEVDGEVVFWTAVILVVIVGAVFGL